MEDRRDDKTHREYIQALRDYRDHFDTVFPTYGFWGTAEETIACIQACLKEGKTVYEMGVLPDPTTIGGIVY